MELEETKRFVKIGLKLWMVKRFKEAYSKPEFSNENLVKEVSSEIIAILSEALAELMVEVKK